MVITKFEDLDAVRKFISANSKLAFDTETTGLNTRKDHVIGFALSNGTQSFYICHKTWEGDKLQVKVPWSACKALLEQVQRQSQIVTWNAAFDCKVTKHFFKVDLTPRLYADGMLAFHTTQEEGVPFSQRPFALKTVAAHFYGPDVVSEQADMKASIKANGGSPNEFYKADLEPMARYCMQDAVLTWRLTNDFLMQIEAEGLSEFFFEEEVMPLYKDVLIPMELHGLPLDMQLLQTSLQEITQDIQNLETQIQAEITPFLDEFNQWFVDKEYPPKRTGPFAQAAIALYLKECMREWPGTLTGTGDYSLAAKNIELLPESYIKDWLQEKSLLPDKTVQHIQRSLLGDQRPFNLLSKHHLKKLFFEKLGEKATSFTDLGSPQVNDEFIETMVPKYPWAGLLRDFNRLTKIKSAYIERYLEEEENGIWYASFQLHRTVSGRLGSDAQQMPRPLEPGQASDLVVKYTNRIRHFFKAAPEHCFIEADYESLEPKVFAHVSTDPKVQEIFHRGLDFYSHIAIMTEGLKEVSADKKAPNYLGKVDKAKRQAAKPYALGIPYGMSGYKLQFEIGVPQKQADQLVANYLRAFPDLHNWMQETAARVCSEGRISVETGRIRRFPRAVQIYKQYGDAILNDLHLWKQYHEDPAVYDKAKKARREFKNYINNGNNVQIQGLAASIVNRACIKIARALKAAGLKTQICLQVHDSIATYGPKSEAAQVSCIMQEIMENNYKISVPLIAEPKMAETYGGTK
jgi:DNA polymerase I-like protein with 3'-5' exonuclease and polymerase domains